MRGQTVTIAERSLGDLGLTQGAVLSRVLGAALDRGLRPCPTVTAPYLRLARPDQASAPDTVMSRGRAPTGSVTVASTPLREDDSYPKGFYLRTVDGQPWLRGYRCDDRHVWSPDDRFAFALPAD